MEDPQILPLDPQPLVIAARGGPRSYSVEIADDASERAVGMMFRKSAPRDRGMLFDFGQIALGHHLDAQHVCAARHHFHWRGHAHRQNKP